MEHGKRRILLALLLCASCLMSGPLHPLTVYANLNVDYEEDADDDIQEEEEEPEADEQDADEQDADDSSVEAKYQPMIDQINDKLDDLQAQKKEIEQSINEAKTQKEKEKANKNYIDKQISITKDEITLLLERIAVLEEDIADKEQAIEEKQAEIDRNYALFKTRLRTSYMYDDATVLGLILGADSFSDFLAKTENVVRLADHDRNLMETLTRERKGLEADKAALEKTKTQVEADKAETESKKQQLNVQLAEANLKIQDIEEMERQFLADLEKNKALQAAMQKELDEIYKQIEWDKNPYVGGQMAWPVPGYSQISSYYGWRFSGKDFHTGMDITGGGVYGKAIVAANAGTVKFVNWTYTQGRGYGIYLIIDHGGNMSTLYAHCSNIVVKLGDKVQRGQKIAEVGNTGWSTGPHLHFEVRVNGQHTNPLPYVKG